MRLRRSRRKRIDLEALAPALIPRSLQTAMDEPAAMFASSPTGSCCCEEMPRLFGDLFPVQYDDGSLCFSVVSR